MARALPQDSNFHDKHVAPSSLKFGSDLKKFRRRESAVRTCKVVNVDNIFVKFEAYN